MHWILLWILTLYPSFSGSPQIVAMFQREVLNPGEVARDVDFARDCVQGSDACWPPPQP